MHVIYRRGSYTLVDKLMSSIGDARNEGSTIMLYMLSKEKVHILKSTPKYSRNVSMYLCNPDDANNPINCNFPSTSTTSVHHFADLIRAYNCLILRQLCFALTPHMFDAVLFIVFVQQNSFETISASIQLYKRSRQYCSKPVSKCVMSSVLMLMNIVYVS